MTYVFFASTIVGKLRYMSRMPPPAMDWSHWMAIIFISAAAVCRRLLPRHRRKWISSKVRFCSPHCHSCSSCCQLCKWLTKRLNWNDHFAAVKGLPTFSLCSLCWCRPKLARFHSYRGQLKCNYVSLRFFFRSVLTPKRILLLRIWTHDFLVIGLDWIKW